MPPRAGRTVLAVDPGAPGKTAGTGIVLVHRQQLLAHLVCQLPKPDGRGAVITAWLDEVFRGITDVLEEAAGGAGWPHVDLVAVEDVNAPTPHLGMIDPWPLFAAATVAGMAWSWHPLLDADVVVVPPGDHGAAPAVAYPPPLNGHGKATKHPIRHARSAYDIAIAAQRLHRLQGAPA